MKKQNEFPKFYWHMYHNPGLIWMVEDKKSYRYRIDTIKTLKPIHEIEDRIKWFVPVIGELPQELFIAWESYSHWDQVYREHLPQIEALHKKECPNCN